MSARKAFSKATSNGLKYKPLYTPPPPPSPPKPRPKLAPILIGGTFLYMTATYVSMLVFKSKNDTNDMVTGKGPEDPTITPKSFDTAGVWETVAKKYDQEINWDEIIMGVSLLRRFLIAKAKVCVFFFVRKRNWKLKYHREMYWKCLRVQDVTLTIINLTKLLRPLLQIDTSPC